MNLLVSVILLISLLSNAINGDRHDIYSGFTVYGVKLKNNADRETLHEATNKWDLDIWERGQPPDRDALVMLKPAVEAAVLEELDKADITYYLHIADVAKSLREQDEQMRRWVRNRNGNVQVFEHYPRHDEVNEYLEKIALEHPDIVTLVDAGPSYEGRRIKYLKISTTGFSDTSKPVYFMDAMMHAREWVTAPVTLYAIHRLVEDLREQDRDLLDTVDWIILPIVNPDGYEFTHTDMRLWRRTRSVHTENENENENCFGVDVNRNFDIDFNTVGVSSNPCSDVYCGPEPFSEPETRIVRDIIHENLDRMQTYINIHSFGNYILYGFDNYTMPSNVAHLNVVGASMGAAMDVMRLPQADYYQVGNSALVLYPASGTSQDYVQDIGVPFSLTLELPGYNYGFQVPPEYIDHINQETWEGFANSARLARLFYAARIPQGKL